MATLTIDLPDELFGELKETAVEMGLDPSALVSLCFQYFSQTETLDNIIEGLERTQISEDNLITFPGLKEELDLDFNFHPHAIEELETLEQSDQIEVISQLVERLSQEDELLDEGIDIVIKDEENASLLMSSFDFGDIIYRVSEELVTIYHIALDESMDEAFDEDEDEMAEFEDEDEMFDELGELGEDEFEFGEDENEH